MNPVDAVGQIERHLQDYIRRTLPVERALPEFTAKLDALFSQHRMAQDPYLELVPPYRSGCTLQKLVEDGVIHKETADIFAKAFLGDNGQPAQFRMYQHQEDAIRAVCIAKKNLVVCSGTGSGKTECFLIPLINQLIGEWIAAGRPLNWNSPGVRAMVLYPMNALVNDQIRRLRAILRHATFITFGKYTGELKQIGDEEGIRDELADNIPQHIDAIKVAAADTRWSGAGFDDEAPLPNEVTRRSVWEDSPAHILVTNYSMLERLLLQPETSNLFENPWRFIILDEAHCYDGALGTEIAWLVRRLRRRLGDPENLRYIATSATLISDPVLANEQKEERIRKEFASRLFPAAANTFAVQFGQTQGFEPLAGSHGPAQSHQGSVYTSLVDYQLEGETLDAIRQSLTAFPRLVPKNETSLFALTQCVLGAERWLAHLQQASELAKRIHQPVAAGDALYLLKQINASVEMGWMTLPDTQVLKQGFLTNEQLAGLAALVDFLVAGIGRLSDNNAWRERLHDFANPSPSSIEGDDEGNPPRRKRYGNRLYLRQEWANINNRNLDKLTVDGLSYLLKTAVELAATAADETGQDIPAPLSVAVTFSHEAQQATQQFFEQWEALKDALGQSRQALTKAWQQALTRVAGIMDPPAAMKVEELLYWFLGADKRLQTLVSHLEEAMQHWETADSGKFTAAANTTFGVNAKHDGASLVALISLAAMAIPKNSSRPLMDIRYHQLLRGLREVGISFAAPGADNRIDFTLHASDALTVNQDNEERTVFTLGACRTCGQPFVLGYAKVAKIDGGVGTVFLSRMKSETHKYLHAIAWLKGGDYPEAENGFPKNQHRAVSLNRLTGQARVDGKTPLVSEGWVKGYWYVAPANDSAPELFKLCPCCGDDWATQHKTRFGIITPYSSQGEQVRLVLLDELARVVDPSADPSARRHPGEGRKVLAFSDSRRGAAGLAFRYQELFSDMTLERMVPKAAELLRHEPLDERIEEYLYHHVPPETRSFVTRLQFAQKKIDDSDVLANAASLRRELEQENCGRLLEVGDILGNDFDLNEAAQLRFLQALRKKGRHTVLRSRLILLESKALNHAKNHNVMEWADAIALTQLGPNQLMDLCQSIHLDLFERIRIQVPELWPEDIVNPRWSKVVWSQKEAPPARQGQRLIWLRFVSGHSQSILNMTVRRKMNLPDTSVGRESALKVLESLWPLFAQQIGGNTRVLVDGGDGQYFLNWEDFVVRPGHVRTTAANAEPHEKYDAYLSSRDIIPLRIEEHTAQLATEKGAAYQKAFASGQINILSCSTTFEMGVDLGDLTCVFLANLPPGVVNYRQRSGRAGRRPGTAAYVLSFVGDAPHDQYFFDHTAELLFGPVQTPCMYLENALFRARHLRAEALHDFLAWMENDNRWTIDGTNPENSEEIRHRRKWKMTGDFFVGRKAGRVDWQRRVRPITGRFDPIAASLFDWQQQRRADLANYLQGIADVPENIGYNVADDLVWQLYSQEPSENTVVPYTLNDPEKIHAYRELAGPNQPREENGELVLDTNAARREVQELIRATYNILGNDRINGGGNNPPLASLAQGHLLNESTIVWLTRKRVLPKYGFPVDVIRLMPNAKDVHGRNVELERDLKIGLYEYAPGQQVMADKRLYPVKDVAVFLPGGVPAAVADAGQNMYRCANCREPYRHQPENGTCLACGSDVEALTVIQPDAFLADTSRSATGGVQPQRATAQQIYTGGVREPQKVPKMRMRVAESNSGELMYLNFGPKDQGFQQGGQNFSLFHDVKTDIAVWLPDGGLFVAPGELAALQGQPLPGGGNRLRAAMQSALEAVLRAAALELQVAEREIGGLLCPDQLGGRGMDFVLFDESSGGGGAVLPLTLTGTEVIDERRRNLIRSIVESAIKLCEDCRECNAVAPFSSIDFSTVPVTREEFLNPHGDFNFRQRQSCYHCLRSYRNQRVHQLVDRGDAVVVLRALLE